MSSTKADFRVSGRLRHAPMRLLLPVLIFGTGFPAFAQEPLSANDWLSGSVQEPPSVSAWRPGDARPHDARPKPRGKGGAAIESGRVEPVQVTRLDGENPDRAGTLPPRLTGLPPGLWGATPAPELITQIAALPALSLPALARFERRLWLARLAPPMTERPEDIGKLFMARVDRLLSLGALDAARALLETSGAGDSESFRRRFDIALLQGDEARACEIMDATPGIAPSFPARILCLAMGGDWNAAALTFRGAQSLGLIDPETEALLEHYLDDGFTDLPEVLTLPERPSPLTYRMHETIGQPLATIGLPLAFAQADLRANTGWKAQLEAAERLARAGSLAAPRLRVLYTERRPAASGGVWERARAVQALLAAIEAEDMAAIDRSLPETVHLMAAAGLLAPLGDMISVDLNPLALTGASARLALRLAIYTGDRDSLGVLQNWADAAGTQGAEAELDRFLIAMAKGDPLPQITPASASAERATQLAPVFTAARAESDELAPPYADLDAQNRRGEALLAALSAVDQGAEGDFNRAVEGLRYMRHLGLDGEARRAAVQLILAPEVREAAARAPQLPEAGPEDEDAHLPTGFDHADDPEAMADEDEYLTLPPELLPAEPGQTGIGGQETTVRAP